MINEIIETEKEFMLGIYPLSFIKSLKDPVVLCDCYSITLYFWVFYQLE